MAENFANELGPTSPFSGASVVYCAVYSITSRKSYKAVSNALFELQNHNAKLRAGKKEGFLSMNMKGDRGFPRMLVVGNKNDLQRQRKIKESGMTWQWHNAN